MKPYTLEFDDDGNVIAKYEYRCFRFLFEGGRTVDVFSIYDDSHLREDLLKLCKEERIAGVANVLLPKADEHPVDPIEPTKPLKDLADAPPVHQTAERAPAKKAAAKKATAKKAAGGVKKAVARTKSSA